MRHYNKCGIHSRLRNIIAKSGGYDVYMAAELLMQEYGIDNKEIALEMARNQNIKEKIKTVGLDAVIESTNKTIIKRRLEFEQFMAAIKFIGSYYF